ncbi:NAD(+) kinase [Congregibacter litoralis]|uniref:NAD kinase n=1 Tax=Congregibacter litoralis KT71 TaxID=314285 RepID=A4A7W4_9GAMM|nr:NAD(+) kinase [Congregibacter litoralis]EAQ97759.1 putative sugar kinase [Congregibacter litoralis KT71]
MPGVFSQVGVVGRSRQEGIETVLEELIGALRDAGATLLLEDRFGELTSDGGDTHTRDSIGAHADLIIVLGGDGSMLSAAREMLQYGKPMLGVNRGRLGFLTDISPDRVREQIAAVMSGDFSSEERFLLDVSVQRNGETVAEGDALNDVVVNSGTSAQMIEVELYIDDEFVNRQRADGLIVSTPTGSTAYSLSGGGPIMHPSLDALLVLPMFPHALSSRPIVIRGDSEIRIDVLARNRIHPPVTCDGQVNMTARPGDSVLLRRNPAVLTLLHPPGHSFYASCRDKLRWSGALVD